MYILNDNGQQLIRRSSHSGPGFTVGNNARRILPGKSEVWIVWLYHDLDYCGNLSVGKHTLVIQMPIWVRSTKVAEWRSAMVKSEPLLISVENGPVDAGTWEKVWRSIDADVLHRVSQGASSEEARAEALESLTSELNDAPMIPMVKWESGLLYLRALEATPAGAEHQRLRQRGEKLLLDLTEAADAPRSMRIQAIEKAMELHRETPDLKKVRELAGRLLTLDPDNVKAKKWLDAVDELERRGLERR